MANVKDNFGTEAVLKEIYPIIEKIMKERYIQWKKCMSDFIQSRSEDLFDIAPCERIYYTDRDRDLLYSSLNINPQTIREGLKHTYYWNKHPFKPQQAKDEISIICLCIVRYFSLQKNEKDLDLAMIYQSFSGKYYPSIHYGFFKTVAPSKYRHVMEYVVNHKLTQKYELKAAGSVIGAVKSLNKTWEVTYRDMIKSFDDEDVTYLIQQLHTRLKSFMKNIASLYYEAYKDKEYITYDKDSLPGEGDSGMYHLTSNDSFKLQQYVERTMEKINTSQVDYAICKQVSDNNVKTEEVKNILEAILNERDNLKKVKEMITLMIASFMEESEIKEVNSIYFLNHCIKQRSNIQNSELLRIKEIEEELLEDNSVAYRKRKHRNPTRLSYHKCIAYYFALIIIKANK